MEDENRSPPTMGTLFPYFKPQKLAGRLSDERDDGIAPLLMQRQKSSAIDVTAFSFAKPAARQGGFSLRALPKQSLLNSGLSRNPRASEPQVEAGAGKTTPVANDRSKHSIEREQRQPELVEPPRPRRLDQFSEDLSDENGDASRNVAVEHAAEGHQSNSVEPQENMESNDNNTIAHFLEGIVNSEGARTGSHPVPSGSVPDQDCVVNATVPTPSSRPPIRPNNDGRVSKRRREKGRNRSARQQSLTSDGKLTSHALTEERLFELLIGKIRQREENEIASANVRYHLEEQNVQLASENEKLRQQLDSYEGQLKKMTAESKARQSRMDSWKTRLQKFKDVVNELGNDYEALRNESHKMREEATSLEKEKCYLVDAIDGIKIQVARAEATIDEQESKIAADDKEITTLRQALEHVNEKLEDARGELVEEKKRAASLESYIVNYARDQARQLISIKEDQFQLLEKATLAIALSAEESTASKDTILSEMRTLSEDLQSSVQILSENCASERLEVQEFSNTAHDIVSRLISLSTRFTEDIAAGTKANTDLSAQIREDWQSVRVLLGPDSTLVKELDGCMSLCQDFSQNVVTIESSLSALHGSVDSLAATEASLEHDLKDFAEKLAKAQIPTNQPGLEKEFSAKFAENTQLQLQVQKISSEKDALQRELHTKATETEHIRISSAEISRKLQETETRVQQLESDKLTLQSEVAIAAQRTQEEKDRSITSNDQMKAQYERQLKSLQQEKEDHQKGTGELISQLDGVRDSLIEAKRIIDEQSKERGSLAEETEQEIQELNASYSEAMARLDAQTSQIQQYQEMETNSCIEKSDLREELKQARETIKALEAKGALTANTEDLSDPPARDSLTANTENLPGPSVKTIVPFAAFEDKLSPQREVSPYDDPADFAMLLDSQDVCVPAQSAQVNASSNQIESAGAATSEQKGQLPTKEKDSTFDIFENLDQPQFTKKRKAVNFKATRPDTSGAEAGNSQQGSSQNPTGQGERPSKTSRHVHKWTYSRIRTTSTEMQQEQSTSPGVGAVSHRRVSPKGLVSASSASNAAGRTNTRSRGKRRSRGERYNARFSQEG